MTPRSAPVAAPFPLRHVAGAADRLEGTDHGDVERSVTLRRRRSPRLEALVLVLIGADADVLITHSLAGRVPCSRHRPFAFLPSCYSWTRSQSHRPAKAGAAHVAPRPVV